MSWLFSQALVEEYSAANCSGGKRFVPSNKTNMPQAYLWRDKTTDAWKRFPSGMTCGRLMATRGVALLTLFLEDFRVRISASPEKDQESPGNDLDYGLKCGASLAKYDPDSSSWKTAQHSLFGGLEQFSGIWPRWGMMRGGEFWALLTPARLTSGSESGLWPTPLRNCGTGPGTHGTGGLNIQTAVAIWPTPTKCGNYNRTGASKNSGNGLATVVKMYPTPTVQDSKNNGPPSQSERNTPPLNAVVGGKLNPLWVEWLMGWPLGWTDLHASGTDKFQQWRLLHGASCQETEKEMELAL